MIDKEKQKLDPKKQWAKFIIGSNTLSRFLVLGKKLVGTHRVTFYLRCVHYEENKMAMVEKTQKGPIRFIMGWVDAIVFALVAVYFINLFFFQNYVIPSSSLEKSLLTGDYLFVSKLSYGPRIPQTPLTMPLTQHTLPFFNIKSYIEFPHWEYRRVPGLGKVKLNDIVVFNYPAGDTIVSEPQYQADDYYRMVYEMGTSLLMQQNPKLAATKRMLYNNELSTIKHILLDETTF